MEVADPADHRGAGDQMVAIGHQLLEQTHILGIAFA